MYMSIGSDLLKALKNHNGVDIDRQTVEEWVERYGEELRQSLLQGGDKKTTWVTSGNSMVVGFAMRSGSEPENVFFEIWVCKVVERASICAKVPLALGAPKNDPNYCCCSQPKVKRVDISSNLGYDYCEICKKEKK
jgi:hypothetical protein